MVGLGCLSRCVHTGIHCIDSRQTSVAASLTHCRLKSHSETLQQIISDYSEKTDSSPPAVGWKAMPACGGRPGWRSTRTRRGSDTG